MDCDSDEDIFADEDDLRERRRSGGQVSPCPGAEIASDPERAKVELLVNKLKSLMTGVPPPPQITGLLAFSASIMFGLWHANRSRFSWSDEVKGADPERRTELTEANETEEKSMPIFSRLAEKGECHKLSDGGGRMKMGINYNQWQVNEELELLTCRYAERYVGAETDAFTASRRSSTPSKAFSRPLTASAKKRARLNGWTVSPRRRLSYLARRRTTFGIDQLVNRQRQRATSLLVVDVATKKNKGSRTCAGSAKKLLKQKSSGRTVQSCPKRALFQSPDEPPKVLSSGTPNDRRTPVARRALWPSAGAAIVSASPAKSRASSGQSFASGGNGSDAKGSGIKRRKSSASRSLSFGDHSATTPATLQLSKIHKQKLLWAVSNALKAEGITQSDSRFRTAGTALFKQCGRAWLYRTSSSLSPQRQSTSDVMLETAKAYLPGILAEMKAADEAKNGESQNFNNAPEEREVPIVSTLVSDRLLHTQNEQIGVVGHEQLSLGASGDETPAQTDLAPTVAVAESSSLKRKRSPERSDGNELSATVPPAKVTKFCVTRDPPVMSGADDNLRHVGYTRVVLKARADASLKGDDFIHAKALKRAESEKRRVVRVRKIDGDMIELYIPNWLLVEDDAPLSPVDFEPCDYINISRVAQTVDLIAKAFRQATDRNGNTGSSKLAQHHLTEPHKKKLLWAASKALHETRTSPRSRKAKLATLLKRLRSVWNSMMSSGSVPSVAAATDIEGGGTSDRMLNVARSILRAQENCLPEEGSVKIRFQLRDSPEGLKIDLPDRLLELTGYETSIDTELVATRAEALIQRLVNSDKCTVRLNSVAALASFDSGEKPSL